MGVFYRYGCKLYTLFFARQFFYKWNRWVLQCGLKGLGVDNFCAGEKQCLNEMISSLPEPVVIDVGAHVGWWSRMALEINPSSRIYAIEPHPETFKTLKTVPGIKPFNLACGDYNGTGMLYNRQDKTCSSHSSLDASVITDIHRQKASALSVPVTTLDQFLLSEKIEDIALLKLDVEGFEYEVLQGAKEAISQGKIRAIVFEFNQMNIARKRFFRDFLELLPDYAFYRLLPKGKIPLRRYDPTFWELFGYQNILAVQIKWKPCLDQESL